MRSAAKPAVPYPISDEATTKLVFSIHVKQTEKTRFAEKIIPVRADGHSHKTIPKKAHEYKMSVEIGEGHFGYIQNGNKHIFDFVNRRIVKLDLSRKIFSDDSLYADIAYRTCEFKNRLLIGSVLSAGGIDENPMPPVFLEHKFSLPHDSNMSESSETLESPAAPENFFRQYLARLLSWICKVTPVFRKWMPAQVGSSNSFSRKRLTLEISETKEDGVVYFRAADEDLLSYSRTGHQVSREEKKRFIRFFRYIFGGHPLIIEKLAADNTIPKSIWIHHYDFRHEKSILTLSSIKTNTGKPFSLKGYRPGILPNDAAPISVLLHRIKNAGREDFNHHLSTLLSNADDYFRKGNYLDAILAYLEYNLSTGLPLPETYWEHKEVMEQNENVKALLGAMEQSSKADGEISYNIFKALEEKAVHQKHLFNIFKGTTQMRIGNHSKAAVLFYKALEAAPHVTGVYKDLGGVFFGKYEMVLAWRCWDLGRSISPTQKMLEDVTEYECKLSSMYPEFF